MKIKLKLSKLRNPLHDHPLMRKGGVHDKSGKATRRMNKQKLKTEWGSLKLLLNSIFTESHLKLLHKL